MNMNKNNLLKFVGKRIRDFRNRCGLSQEELSFKCNLDRTYISDIELGKRNVSLLNIQVLTDALGIHIEKLFSGFENLFQHNNNIGKSPYKINKNAAIQCGFQVKSSDVEYAAIATSNQLENLPFTLFQSIDLKALSGMVGAIFAMNLSKQVDAIVNPIEKGHPDIIPKSAKNASEEELKNYSEGLEIKCTIGNVIKGSELKTGQQRIDHLSGITWQAHHREVKTLMGLVIDFSGNKIGNKYFPSISGIFFADNLKIDDWGAISGTTGRNTKVTGMKSSGKKKMGSGWILLLNQSSYISRYKKILSIPA